MSGRVQAPADSRRAVVRRMPKAAIVALRSRPSSARCAIGTGSGQRRRCISGLECPRCQKHGHPVRAHVTAWSHRARDFQRLAGQRSAPDPHGGFVLRRVVDVQSGGRFIGEHGMAVQPPGALLACLPANPRRSASSRNSRRTRISRHSSRPSCASSSR